MTTVFLNVQIDPNRFLGRDQRFFLQEFLEFYLSKGKKMVVIDSGNLISDLLQKYHHLRIHNGVADVAYEDYIQLIPTMKNIHKFSLYSLAKLFEH